MRTVVVGSDHVGYPLKRVVVDYLTGCGLEVVDAGPENPDLPVDYPVYAQTVALQVAAGQADWGVVVCGTGLGMSIAANKVPGARAALCSDIYMAHQARSHNDANVLALGAWVVTPQRLPGILDEWLRTDFEGGRHISRVQSLDRYFYQSRTSPAYLDTGELEFTAALSINPSVFGPLLYAGRFETGLQALSANGFHAVEVSLRHADDLTLAELEKLLDQYNLRLTALATGQGCLQDGLCMSALDPTLRRRAVQRFETIIQLAAHFKAAVIMGGVRGRLSVDPVEQPVQRAGAVAAIRECAQYAAELDVPFLIEPINRYETNFVNTAAQGMALIEEIGLPTPKLLLDTYHMNLEEVDMCAAVRQAGPHLGYLHLVDSNRHAPGQGHIDLRGVLACALESGYRGVVSAEILPLPDDWTALQQTRQFIQSLNTQSCQLEGDLLS